jgi:hypothetical protein
MSLQTEVSFTLPLGIAGADGEVHREGVMRLATARDEIQPLATTEVRRNEAYLGVLLLARTVVSIGPVSDVTPELIEGLYAADYDHLQRLYERLNTDCEVTTAVECPDCHREFSVNVTALQDEPPGK